MGINPYTMDAAIQAMKWLGVDCGRNRRPFKSLKTEEIEALRMDLSGFKKKGPYSVKILEVI